MLIASVDIFFVKCMWLYDAQQTSVLALSLSVHTAGHHEAAHCSTADLSV